MNSKTTVFGLCAIVLFSLAGCSQRAPETTGEEYYTYGKATILADESLFPIVDDEHQVFLNEYKRADVNIIYKPLKEAMQLFVSDSIDVLVAPRMLKPDEAAYFDKRKIKIRATKFATDGIALITGKSSADSLITVEEIVNNLKGKSVTGKILVFDNPQSSTVEYLMQLSGVNILPKSNVYALKSNQEVIKYIGSHPNAIGIVSVNWMKRPTPELVNDVAKVKFMAVKDKSGVYQLPTQSNLKIGHYPLSRDLFLIDCQGKAGLGTGFAAFLASDIGQRIILKSGLAPDSLPSRQINIRN